MSCTKNLLYRLQSSLEKISDWRDRVLWVFIKPHWPRKITPNHLTWARIVIGIIIFILLFFFGMEDKNLLIFLVIIGILTDLFDGSVARGLNKVTEFGAMLDPLADRVLLLPVIIYSLYKTHWVLILIWILTEIINASTSIIYKKKRPYTESNIFGKTKVVILCVVIVAILIVWPNPLPLFFVNLIWLAIIFCFLSIFTKMMELKDEGHINHKIFTKKYRV
jgi:CDP-diacylglycerol--glycerol-3-phosphate 3-phosphatidyltransferase